MRFNNKFKINAIQNQVEKSMQFNNELKSQRKFCFEIFFPTETKSQRPKTLTPLNPAKEESLTY